MDESRLREAIQIYFDATNTSDETVMAEVFHDSAHLYSIGQNGSLLDWDKDTFMGIMKSGREAHRGEVFEPVNEIMSIDYISEDLAVARIRVGVFETIYADILSFICLDDRWWIIAKTTVAEKTR